MKKTFYSFKLIVFLVFVAQMSFGQNVTIKGTIADESSGDPIIGASILVKGTTTGTITDVKGSFSIQAEVGSTLVVSYLGYMRQEIEVKASMSNLDIKLKEDAASLSEVVIVGSRFEPRSLADSPVPIDNISVSELRSVGHVEIDQMLTYKAPSYNSSNQTVSDATAHMNPADLRGLGPSRTLVLINGKRKNASSLVYINDTPGKGEVGVDMKSIPVAAIERIEVLRDGASAQYGSDAIAGVINVVLKQNTSYSEMNVAAGVTSEGDGETFAIDGNFGFQLGAKGFMNVTTSFSDQGYTNRPGQWRQNDEAGLIVPITNDELAQFPDAGMIVGQPEMVKNDVFFNMSLPVSNLGEFYSFGGITNRTGKSFALNRNPSFAAIYGYDESIFGTPNFHPTFETDIFDNTIGFGLKGTKNGWNFDLSSTYGSNKIDYTIGNTINASLGIQTPTEFYAGGYEFKQTTNNFDVSRNFDKIGVAFGFEYRIENFIATAGEENSYIGGGAVSFPGLQPSNEVDKKRHNVSYYADIEANLTDNFMFSVAGRYENYSDFGDNLTGKLSTRLKINDQFTIRGSVSTGFRAPSLHQIYLSNIQTLISGGTVSDQGTFNNHSPIIRAFNVPRLKQETSVNIGAGLTYQANDNFLITADFYQINVDDRIVFTGEISNNDPTTTIGGILDTYDITSFKFFINGIDTKTTGFDLVASYNNIELGGGELDVSFAANFNKTDIQGDLKTPDLLSTEGNTLFNRKERSRIETARPNDKFILGLTYKVSDFTFTLNNTRFGEVTWRNAVAPGTVLTYDYFDLNEGDIAPDWDQTFSAKVVTDLNISYKISDKFMLSIGANNVFDVYPDEINPNGDPVTDLAGRFRYPWEVNQFGFNGRYHYAKLNIRL